MVRWVVLLTASAWASPAVAQQTLFEPGMKLRVSEPELQLGNGSLALPIIEYRAPDGTWKRGQGIIVGRDISPNATVGLGFFRIKPKYQDQTASNAPAGGGSKKVSLGLSLRF